MSSRRCYWQPREKEQDQKHKLCDRPQKKKEMVTQAGQDCWEQEQGSKEDQGSRSAENDAS